MYLDGLPQASTESEVLQLHRLIGTLPVVLHPDPRRVLVIGLGGGVTAGSAAASEDARVEVVELSDEVIEGARFFRRVNHDVLERPNVHVRVDDGRNFLLLTDRRYDVVTADVIQPQHAGAGKVWSVEYWRLVRAALDDDGIALQWVGADRPEHVYKLIVRSFLEVFPNATLWDRGRLLVATKGPLEVDVDALRAKFADPRYAFARGLAGIASIDALLGLFTAGPEELRAFVGEGPTLTDDRPRTEYYRSLPQGRRFVDLSRLRGDVRSILR